jgi:type II secretory ATPase GspE/PulE/Tfp pilus assembly ATPase PilB-like protein
MELKELNEYAKTTQLPLYTTQADLDPKDKPMVEMHAWCARQGDLVVLSSGLILASNPVARSVQNCKIIMRNKGVSIGQVVPAAQSLISMLLANATSVTHGERLADAASVSEQQQRLRALVREARLAQASDIHLEVREDVARIRFRKHGELYLHAEWIPKLAREITSVAFNKETDNAVSHFNPLLPQSASMSLRIDGVDVRLRLASLPAHGGYDVVMRLLTSVDENILSLKELGYTEDQCELLQRAIDMPHGAVLISGPTGSGKTTTVASCLNTIKGHRKVYTIEEPVEKLIRNASQIPINTEHDDRGFASMGRATLRMDPDVITLGEMRDEETAHVMVRAAITGHLVFSTLHTNSATAIVTRLLDMGISASLLSDSNLLVALVCQRLVPVLCTYCSQSILQSALHKPYLSRWRQVFGDGLDELKVRGFACSECRGIGLSGRTVVAEIIWLDKQSRGFIQKADVLGWEHYLEHSGWQSHQHQALELIKMGKCDPLDVERIIGPLSVSV